MTDTRKLAEAARQAYATGVALSGARIDERVKAGCTAAVALALESPDDPNILELALDLGSLAGTWAMVYKRRSELEAAQLARVMKVWRKLVRRLRPRDLITRFRRDAILPAAEARRREGPDKWIQDEARQSALGWLYQIYTDPQYDDLAQAVTTALVAAAAEGKTAALAVAADQASAAGFDWAKAYAAMYSGLAQIEGLPGMGDPWVQRILGGAATEVGRVLAAMATSGASDSEMSAAIMDIIDGGDVRAVSVMIDYAIGQSMTQATLDLYRSEGTERASFLTAGDGRVCVTCESYEGGNPYLLADVPSPPVHVNCRCTIVSDSPLSLSAFADFLVLAG